MKILSCAVLTAAAVAPSLFACDLCSVYAAGEARGQLGRGVFAGIAEQFTHFGTLQEDGRKIPNEHNEVLDSSITQILAGYNFSDRFGIQLNVPLIHRSFRREHEDAIDRGTESGVGDTLLLAHFQPYSHDRVNLTVAWSILGGIKFPTGSSSRLEEETHEEEGGEHVSGIHGHDLTLGSGSWDGLIGTSFYLRWKRAFFFAETQYAIRSEGDFGYQFANDLTWSAGPGVLLALEENFTVSLQANVSGETKGRDEFRGETAEDTGVTSVFVGPGLVVTWREKLSGEVGVDLPVLVDNTAVQIVPDYRVRAAFIFHF